MPPHTLAIQGQRDVDYARSALTPDQIRFAEWLALPTTERNPLTQKELAASIGTSEVSLCNWKRIPEVWIIRDSLISSQGKEMVTDALKTIKKLLKSGDSKVALRAAMDVLDRWAEPRRHASIIANIKDMYDHYHPK